MPKYDILATAEAEFNRIVEADTRDEAIEIAKDAVTQRHNLNVKVERVIFVPPTNYELYVKGEMD